MAKYQSRVKWVGLLEVKKEVNELLKNNGKKSIDETDETNEEYDFDAIKEDVIAKAQD